MQQQTPSIVVLSGGISKERDVSIRSGISVLDALTDAGYHARGIDITGDHIPVDTIAPTELVFSVLHGEFGEDGTAQQQLESAGITFVGSGASASMLCFQKDQYRQTLQQAGLPIAAGVIVTPESAWQHELLRQPFVLKPIRGGSSIDTFIVTDIAQTPTTAIHQALQNYGSMLLEQLVSGTEITVAVLGDTPLPVIEIIPPSNQTFDYHNKYNGKTMERCPAELIPAAVQTRAQDLALAIHQLTGCSDYSRTDMIVRPDGSLIVLETNTLPGMTDQSLFPKAAAAAGITMPQLCVRLVGLAQDRTAQLL